MANAKAKQTANAKATARMFKEPFEVFTNTADFGETVLIDGVPVAVVFDREYLPNNGFGVVIGNADPQLIVADSKLPPNIKDATITARGVAYSVAEIDYDGSGMSVIQLRKQHDKPAY